MDTTEQYVKMCEKALPDIGCHGWQDGDFAYRNGKIEVFHQKAADNMGWQTGDQCIPLYRQDQLQEMVIDKPAFGIVIGQLIGIHHFALEKYFDTWEQLWLAFVMKERFGKIWSKEKKEWVTDGS